MCDNQYESAPRSESQGPDVNQSGGLAQMVRLLGGQWNATLEMVTNGHLRPVGDSYWRNGSCVWQHLLLSSASSSCRRLTLVARLVLLRPDSVPTTRVGGDLSSLHSGLAHVWLVSSHWRAVKDFLYCCCIQLIFFNLFISLIPLISPMKNLRFRIFNFSPEMPSLCSFNCYVKITFYIRLSIC